MCTQKYIIQVGIPVHQCTYIIHTTYFMLKSKEHPPISMVIFDPILVPSTPPRTIARVMRGEVRLS